MRYLLLIFILLFNGLVFSQNNKIEKERIIPSDIDFKGHVRKITIKSLMLYRMSKKNDSIRSVSEVYFSKNGKIQSLILYDKFTKDSWRKVEFDVLERINTITRINDSVKFDIVNQYFSNNSEFPDSTKTFSNKNYKEKYINRFTNNLVTKQERYVNDVLQDFSVYKYNDQNQLIEDLYTNPENEKGETVVINESGKGTKLSFYPEKQTLYEHMKNKDTTIVVKISPRYSRKEVTKKLKNKEFELTIEEKYNKDFLESTVRTWTSKDSLSRCNYIYGVKGEIRSYYKTFKNPKKIIYISKSDFSDDDQEKVITHNSEIVYDKFKNWIKKTYFKEGVIESRIEREIDYY